MIARKSRLPRKRRLPRAGLGREIWLAAAREALIKYGIANVEIGKLARKLRVTRGGFYWFFTNRSQLLDELLEDWEIKNTAPFRSVLHRTGHSGTAEYLALVDVWITEKQYSSRWDAAVRDWARVSHKVATAVRRIDDERIGIIQRTLLDAGLPELEAFMRARITYFHQVGYYAMGVQESIEERMRLMPLYVRILVGDAFGKENP